MRLTIGAKIIGLMAILLVTAIFAVVTFSSHLFVLDSTEMIQQANADSASHLADQVRSIFENITDKMRTVGTFLTAENNATDPKKGMSQESLRRTADLLAVFLQEVDSTGHAQLKKSAVGEPLETQNDADGLRTYDLLLHQANFSWPSLAKGDVEVNSIKLLDGSAALAIGIPFMKTDADSKTFVLSGIFQMDRLIKSFSESALVTNYLVDGYGIVLAHPDTSLVLARENFSDLEIVKKFLEGKLHNAQMRYVDPKTYEARLGAFRSVGFAKLGVVAEVPEEKAFEATRRITYQASLIAIGVLCLAFMLGYLYSMTITSPIKKLVGAARRISEGDFKISLRVKGRDEIARLARSFNEMAQGLEERDRVKEIFHKFHNKEIAEKLLSGAVQLGGESRDAIILFSDLRNFTRMAESMQPEEVVVMLNEYMTSMVSVISEHGGIVDKYVGDAIMALWGVPIAKENDLEMALHACLGMRQQLATLNTLRSSRNQIPLRIGMGLHFGRVIVGNIGTETRMEYTAIGDTVNLASRIESMTKQFGVDLLVSDAIAKKLQQQFIFKSRGTVTVKGKEKSTELFQVHGYIDANNTAVVVETPFSQYEPSPPSGKEVA